MICRHLFPIRWRAACAACAPRRLGTLCLLAVLCLALPGAAPSAQQSGPLQPRQSPRGPFSSSSSDDPSFDAKRLRALNEYRQKVVVSDAQKLLLATQRLQHEIEAQHPDRLTAAQLRRLTEIEKLARNIRQNMADIPGGGSPIMDSSAWER